MSKKADKFLDKYIVGEQDWLLKHKEVISKLLDEYEIEQLNIHLVDSRRELLVCGGEIVTCPYRTDENICTNKEYCKDQANL